MLLSVETIRPAVFDSLGLDSNVGHLPSTIAGSLSVSPSLSRCGLIDTHVSLLNIIWMIDPLELISQLCNRIGKTSNICRGERWRDKKEDERLQGQDRIE